VAHEVNVAKLLDDAKAYLASNPGLPFNNDRVNIQNIGYRLVEKQEKQYLGDKATQWAVDLKPRANHVDERISIKAPLTKPGAYLITAHMANGNVSRILIWVTDTVIVKKQLENQTYYYVADAGTGAPVPGASLDFFGWRHEQVKPNTNVYHIVTKKFSAVADKEGQLIVGVDRQPPQHPEGMQWLITAR